LGAKIFINLVAILAATGISVVSILRDKITNQQYRQITVVGRGTVSYQPDMATVLLGVQVDKSAKPEEALGVLNRKITAIKAGLMKLGIKDEAIDTRNYVLNQQYDYVNGIQQPAGYSANQQLAVKIDNLAVNKDLVNKVVAAASGAGANQISGVSFGVNNLEDLKQQARVLAIADAKNKAVNLSQTAGVSLTGIAGWYENMPVDMNGYVDGKGGMGGSGGIISPIISAGSNEVVMEIGLSYNIKDK